MSLSETPDNAGQSSHGIQGRPVRPVSFKKTTRQLQLIQLPKSRGQGPLPPASPTPGSSASMRPQDQFPTADRPKPPAG